MDPEEEFAEIKALISALKLREQELREGFLRPNCRLKSNQHAVTVRHQKRKVFQKDMLPDVVLNHPTYWREITSPIVTIKSMGPATADRWC